VDPPTAKSMPFPDRRAHAQQARRREIGLERVAPDFDARWPAGPSLISATTAAAASAEDLRAALAGIEAKYSGPRKALDGLVVSSSHAGHREKTGTDQC